MNSMSISIPAGQPSITPPIAVPCDSPNDVSLNILPKVLLMTGKYSNNVLS